MQDICVPHEWEYRLLKTVRLSWGLNARKVNWSSGPRASTDGIRRKVLPLALEREQPRRDTRHQTTCPYPAPLTPPSHAYFSIAILHRAWPVFLVLIVMHPSYIVIPACLPFILSILFHFDVYIVSFYFVFMRQGDCTGASRM